MDDTKREEIRKHAEMVLGSKDQSARKRRVCDMFDNWSKMRQSDPETAAKYLEELKIWDDVYHSMKDRP